jgi:hypothetical protein
MILLSQRKLVLNLFYERNTQAIHIGSLPRSRQRPVQSNRIDQSSQDRWVPFLSRDFKHPFQARSNSNISASSTALNSRISS